MVEELDEDGSGIWKSLGVVIGVIAGATGNGDREGLWKLTEVIFEFWEEEVGFSEIVDVCTADPVSINFECFSKTGGAKVKLDFQSNPELNPGQRQYQKSN